ncbi:hypothetical protein L3i22_018510 [Actinoplanes sp. L3-i22]|nr:hypothetical protein L3i22_018510 [Actinoplanes sp. L3-i22]
MAAILNPHVADSAVRYGPTYYTASNDHAPGISCRGTCPFITVRNLTVTTGINVRLFADSGAGDIYGAPPETRQPLQDHRSPAETLDRGSTVRHRTDTLCMHCDGAVRDVRRVRAQVRRARKRPNIALSVWAPVDN